MLIPFFSSTEHTFISIKEEVLKKDPGLSNVRKLAEGCSELVEVAARQWIDHHPFGLEENKDKVYADFLAEQDLAMKALVDSCGEVGRLFAPLIKYSEEVFTMQIKASAAEAQSASFRVIACIDARLDYYRLISQWCWRIIGDGEAGAK